MRAVVGTILAAAVVVTAGLVTVAPAQADTENCVSQGEFDQTHRGMSVQQVANLYDVYGTYIGDQGNNQRRAYRTCWAPGERRVIVEFSYNSGDSVDWYVRDVP